MITVISYPLNEINYSVADPTSSESSELVQNLYVDLSATVTDEYVEITFNGVVKTLLITDEYRYEPIDVAFQNKEGAMQLITMFKERKDSTVITSEEFETNSGQGQHQFNRLNLQSRSKFTINTGFIDESHNENIKQLLYSLRTWVISNGQAIPINVSTKNFDKKTRVNDRLINYTLEFEYAFNDINNV
jgi:hypothetical protein